MNLDESLDLVITRLSNNRNFPKYQFERSIDGFISLFIEEYLCLHYGADVRYIAAEFPIKKTDNNQSTNVDYLLYRHGLEPAWLFVELKTDHNSMRDNQLTAYDSFRNVRMRTLLAQISTNIMPGSRQKKKYHYLLDTIAKSQPTVDVDAPIIAIYITACPLPVKTKIKYHNIEWVELSQFTAKLRTSKHPELWKHVNKLLMFATLS
jgi:hypothetical protein